MWFTDSTASGGLVRMSMTGSVKELSLGGSAFAPYTLTVGSDGKFYVATQIEAAVLQVSRSGTVRTFFIPSGDHAEGGLVKGPDGNVWFTEIAHLGEIAMNGAITEFAYPSGGTSRSNFNAGITVGSDARVWFTEDDVGIVANVDPTTDAITEYQAMSPSGLCGADGIAGGTDGALYFACRTASNAYVGKIITGGVMGYSLIGSDTRRTRRT